MPNSFRSDQTIISELHHRFSGSFQPLMIRGLPYGVLALFILAAKWQLIGFYGNATPFWDQWNSEANLLYRPWLEGTLDWTRLFAPANEHRILTTRLLALGLLKLNGMVWNPILQMQVNAVIHVMAIGVLLFYLSHLLKNRHQITLFLFTGILFSIPFGWENTLAGFQSQLYLLLLFSFIFLWGIATLPCYRTAWWISFVVGLLSLLSMASGALAMLAGGLVMGLRRYWYGERATVPLSALILVLGIATLAIYMTPTVVGHAELKAQSPSSFLQALSKTGGWPSQSGNRAFLLIQFPLLLLALQILRQRTSTTPAFMFVLAMGLWLYGQFASIAYGRAATALSPRYQDLFAIGLVLNMAALLILHASTNRRSALSLYEGLALIWLATVALGFDQSADEQAANLTFKAKTGIEQERNVHAYLCNGDTRHIANKPFLHIPFPSPDLLKQQLDSPAIRSILPPNLTANTPFGTSSLNEEQLPCRPDATLGPYEVIMYDGSTTTPAWIANVESIRQSAWRGSDYLVSKLPGYEVIGSLVQSDLDSGLIVLHLKRGQGVLYRSGSRVNGQIVLIGSGQRESFNTELPHLENWAVLRFSNPRLPEEFDVTFVDAGTQWGEWSAIALRQPDQAGRP